jgi:hypothetical protein
MEQHHFSETASHSAGLSWNPKVHCCVHKSLLPLDPILSQPDPVQTLASYFFKIQSMLRSLKWSLFFKLSNYNFVCKNIGIITLKSPTHNRAVFGQYVKMSGKSDSGISLPLLQIQA